MSSLNFHWQSFIPAPIPPLGRQGDITSPTAEEGVPGLGLPRTCPRLNKPSDLNILNLALHLLGPPTPDTLTV